MRTAPHKAKLLAEKLLALDASPAGTTRMVNDLTQLLGFLRTNESLRRFLADPFIRPEGKKKALTDLLQAAIDPPLLAFLFEHHLLEKNPLLERTVRSFFALLKTKCNKGIGELLTPRPLEPQRVQEIEKEISRLLAMPISLKVILTPSMLGGIIVRVGDIVIDGSVEHTLEDIHRKLIA